MYASISLIDVKADVKRWRHVGGLALFINGYHFRLALGVIEEGERVVRRGKIFDEEEATSY